MNIDGAASADPAFAWVPDQLARAAAEYPAVVALATLDSSITYRELSMAASEMAIRLREASAEKGTVVATVLPNGIDWLIAYWGAAINGNVVAPISTRATPAEVERLLGQSGAAVLIDEEGLRCLGGTIRLCAQPGKGESPDRVHLIQFTSGSTGEPKGAMLTHRGLIAAARQHVQDWQLQPGDAVFIPNPFSHILGLMYGVLTPVMARATVLTVQRFDLEQTVELLAQGKAVAMTGAPTHLQMLSEWVEEHGIDLPHLRLGFTGGAPIASEWVDRVVCSLGLESLINGYGMSEVGSIAQTSIDDQPDQVANSVGFLAQGLDARIVDPGTREDLPDGRVGELWLRGPSVMAGYLGKEGLTEEVLVEGGWLRTGDLMRRDPSGRLSFVSRLDDMFTVGGFKVYPAEVERALVAHPAIAAAAVVPVVDDRLGSVPVAFVVAHGAAKVMWLDETSVLKHCKKLLRNYMVPRRVFPVEALPLNRAGKIDKLRLTHQAAESDVD